MKLRNLVLLASAVTLLALAQRSSNGDWGSNKSATEQSATVQKSSKEASRHGAEEEHQEGCKEV
jgi:hypothetical protein